MKDCKGCDACSCVPEYELFHPPAWSHESDDGAFFNRMFLAKSNVFVPQHSHTKAHTTLITEGSMRVWRDGVCMGDYTAPAAVYIPAEIKHSFMSLEPDTCAYCVFSASPVTHEEHLLDEKEMAACLSP